MHRVLKKEGTALITIPWSARFHYKPYDYHRYTPTYLNILFNAFEKVIIKPRGTDINVIANKIIVLYLGMVTNIKKSVILFLPKLIAIIVFLPVICLVVLWGHAALLLTLSSSDDPLGYSIILKK